MSNDDVGLKIWLIVTLGVIALGVWMYWPAHKTAITAGAVPAMPSVQLTMSHRGDPRGPPDTVLLRFPDNTVEWYVRAKDYSPIPRKYDADCALDTTPTAPMCAASKP